MRTLFDTTMVWQKRVRVVVPMEIPDVLRACAVKFGRKAIESRRAITKAIHVTKEGTVSFRGIKCNRLRKNGFAFPAMVYDTTGSYRSSGS